MSALASKTAMVMAAGLGNRMRPLTDHLPKPMIEVAGKPLIDHSLDRLRAAGVARAVVNTHYLADILEEHLALRNAPEIIISDERDLLLETGGGMVKALPHLPNPFFCLNSDNIWIDRGESAFHQLSKHWDASKMDALLLLVPHAQAPNTQSQGDFNLAEDGRISRRAAEDTAPYIYTGIQIVSHNLLVGAPDGKFSTNVLWDRSIKEGRIFGAVYSGYLYEVGRPDHIAPTELALARG